MDFEKLEKEISRYLEDDLQGRSYSDIKEELRASGYNEKEMAYILRAVDDQAILPSAKTAGSSTYMRNIIIGAAVSIISLVVVASLYLGQSTSKEIYYVALALFVVGYIILRSGLKQKVNAKENEEA